MANYLKAMGIDAKVVKEPAEVVFGEALTESVIEVKGQSIDKIRLFADDYISCGMSGSISRFQYQIILDKDLPSNAERMIISKTKQVKENKILGLFAGTIADIKWEGHELADSLNSDGEINNILLRCARHWGNAEFQIDVISPTLIEILGPRFVEADWIPQLDTTEGKRGFEDCVFGFKICNHIAQHISNIIDHRQKKEQ